MTFEAYLKSKKIDPQKFESCDSISFQNLKNYFEQVSPNSFTQQKLFLINDLRRKYILNVTPSTIETTQPTSNPIKSGVSKPIFKPKVN